MAIKTPVLYRHVPKDPIRNMAFRESAYKAGRHSVREAKMLIEACKSDVLFWLNTFGWTYDPRLSASKVVPFVTYEYQDETMLEIEHAIEDQHDIGIDKSRDMGASWMCIAAFAHQFLFSEDASFLMVSRVEDLVDKSGDPKSLFWKIDFMLARVPYWMRPPVDRKRLHIENENNGSVIDGESTTGEIGRGDRRTAILCDEFASVDKGFEVLRSSRDATGCRIFNSTPKGGSTAHAEIMLNTDIRKLHLHWSKHPEKARGLYTVDRKPSMGGKIRSPWYDDQCKRAANRQEIAQELDIDYLGADYQFFDQEVLETVMERDCKEPMHVCELSDFDPQAATVGGFREIEVGRFKLWCPLDAAGLPKPGNYAAGADIATGTGATNSVLSIGDRDTGRKVLEFCDSSMTPQEFARVAVALCRLFKDSRDSPAQLGWEANGPGRLFGREVADECQFRNIYYRESEDKITKKKTETMGWWSTGDTKRLLLGNLQKAMREGQFVNPCIDAVKECQQIIYSVTNNRVEHAKAINSIDPSGARDNHSDRVTADGVLWLVMSSYRASRTKQQIESERRRMAPIGSFAWRQERRREDDRNRKAMAW